MPIKTVIAKNPGGSPVTVVDLGVTILGLQQKTLTDYFRLEELWESADLATHVGSGALVINDGVGDLGSAPGTVYITPVIADEDVNTTLNNASSTASTGNIVVWGAGGTLNGVDLANHASRHLPGGADALTTAAPVAVGTANAAGTAPSFARSDHVHNTPFSAVNAALALANAPVSVNGQRIIGVGTPTASTDAATKAYVDALPTGSGVLRQALFVRKTTDNTTTSSTYALLPQMTQDITITSGGKIRVWAIANVSNSASSNQVRLRLLINGVTVAASGSRPPGGSVPFCQAIAHQQAASPGAGTYTVALHWATTGGTAQCRPVAAPDLESAYLVVEEVT